MSSKDDRYRPWPPGVVRGCAEVLGDTDTGLTGAEIGRLLAALRMPDPDPSASKRVRLEAAFTAQQAQTRDCRRVATFVMRAMEPSQYVDRPAVFQQRRRALNERLAFARMRVDEDGQVKRVKQASATLREAAEHAGQLLAELRHRNTHPEVLRYCTLELLQKNNFHACLEATKSVFDRIRTLTGAEGDGAPLVNSTLALGRTGTPVLAINSLVTESEQKEQTGFASLLIGLFGMYRNPVAHDPRARRQVSDDELLELLTTLSMVHRRLDDARRT